MNLLDIIVHVENWMNTRYQNSPLARQAGTDKLTQIIQSAKSDDEKITVLKKEFPDALNEATSATPEGSTDNSGEEADKAKQTPLDAEALCKTGIQHAEAEDYEQALECFRKAAEQGHADAQYHLGDCYYYGYGVEEDDTQAVEWYRKAAEQGHTDAQYALGECYNYGCGVDKNDERAVEWYRKAAEQGNFDAQLNLYRCYRNGLGIAQNETQAVEWYNRAAEQAEQNDSVIQFNLGLSCEQEHEYNHAVYWYRKAAEQGNYDAQLKLYKCYRYGDGVKEDETQAMEWYNRAAEQIDQSDSDAQYSLGWELRYRLFYDEKAVEWFRKAAEQGHAGAQYELGWCYSHGRGVKKDLKKAVEWFRKAADQGYDAAQCELGDCYAAGRGVKADRKQAERLWMAVAEQGRSDVILNRADKYMNGSGFWSKLSKLLHFFINKRSMYGADLYLYAANLGNARAQYELGNLFCKGKGRDQSFSNAEYWYRRAIANADNTWTAEAQKMVDRLDSFAWRAYYWICDKILFTLFTFSLFFIWLLITLIQLAQDRA